ncbi:hypothetical protein [Streptosporangium sandarakinum]|uniref:hypothetical protein n=1 Tax=Streptosporangium sandarakinum TaxID=1260955 RepID=UPI00343A28C4
MLDQGERLLLLDRAHHLLTGEHSPALTTMQAIIDGGEPVRRTLERLAGQAPDEAVVAASAPRRLSRCPAAPARGSPPSTRSAIPTGSP